jgi:anti-sigma factor RsiW
MSTRAGSNGDDVPCQRVVELLNDYLEGALTPVERVEVDAHLATCPPCQAYLDQLRATVRVSGTICRGDVPEPLMAALLDAYRHR